MLVPGSIVGRRAALKLARKHTGRETVVSFTNAFHGMTLGALAVSGNGKNSLLVLRLLLDRAVIATPAGRCPSRRRAR
jgi:4-aminobutyrate aminotransferase-like enzyme